MLYSLKRQKKSEIIQNLMKAQKNMASSENIDAIGLILLSKFLLRVLEKADDELIEFTSEEDKGRR